MEEKKVWYRCHTCGKKGNWIDDNVCEGKKEIRYFPNKKFIKKTRNRHNMENKLLRSIWSVQYL